MKQTTRTPSPVDPPPAVASRADDSSNLVQPGPSRAQPRWDPPQSVLRTFVHETFEESFDARPIEESSWVGAVEITTNEPVCDRSPRDSIDRSGRSRGRSASTDATLTYRVPDLGRAAASYLESHGCSTTGLAEGWDLSPEDLSDSEHLFVELHRSSPDEAQRLATGLISMPQPGDKFLNFLLIEELGRGAFGRVFLAIQGDLADRLVALKVSTELPGESQTLAQLQHTNIVPIFSVHHAPPHHAVCMPYFGRTTLADLFDDLAPQKSLPNSGKALVKTLGSRRWSAGQLASRGTHPVPPSTVFDPASAVEPISGGEEGGSRTEETPLPESETLRTIASLSYVGAVLWIGARIADGLAHAHGRGILHRDLKPANVLITDDGQPMILDFNLSEDTKRGIGVSEASIGGTLPYMSPEHLERFLGSGGAFDARSDIYAMGVMLFELLTGRRPFEIYSGHSISTIRRMIQDRKVGPPSARPNNPAITPAVESIVRHCLEPDVTRRYQSAAELRIDLERHLADLPLKYANEPSVGERIGKWARRNPRLWSSTSIMAVSVVLLTLLASSLLVRSKRLAWFESSREYADFVEEASSIRFLLNNRTDDQARRKQGEALAVESLGRFHVLDDPNWSTRPVVVNLPIADRIGLREEVAEVLLMLTQAITLDAADRHDDRGRRELAESARKLGRLAMASVPEGREPQAFWSQQAAIARLLGEEQEGVRFANKAESLPLKSARDYYLAATGLALRGLSDQALPLAEEATRMEPKDFWSWFILGVCHDRLEHHSDAMACFTTCIALRPDFADSWFNRGLAYLKRNDFDRARLDFDRSARLRPNWYEPPLHRALAFRGLAEHHRAENDLTKALNLGAPETRVYFLRAAERDAMGDLEGAKLDRLEGLKREPTDVPSWICRGMARMRADPRGALADFAAALKLDPRSLQALQMSAYVLSDLPGQDEETIRMLDRAVEFYPDFVPVRSGRGVQLAILGRREEALRDARESVWRDTSPAILYQVAGIYATTSKTHPEDRLEAYRLLSAALRAGFGFEMIDDDRELDPIRDQPEFRALVDSARAQAKERLPRPPGR